MLKGIFSPLATPKKPVGAVSMVPRQFMTRPLSVQYKSSVPFYLSSFKEHKHIGEIEAPPAESLVEVVQSLRPVGLDGEPSTSPKDPIICSPGAGIFFFWQLGVMDYIAEHYNIDNIPMVGASAGSLLSALTVCGIRSSDIIRTAHKLALDHGVWERSLGIVGIWGPIIRRWLDALLPEDAHLRCSGRVTVVITHVPSLGLRGISQFDSKADLIEALMASVHVPFVIDWRPLASYRGELGMDGSFSEFFDPSTPSYFPFHDPEVHDVVDLDYFKDKESLNFERFEFISLKTYDQVLDLYDKGHMYAQRLYASGQLSCLESRRLKQPRAHVQMPSLPLRRGVQQLA